MGGDETGEGIPGSGGIKRKWGDFETTMKAMKDALVKENEEKSAKIRKLMEENVRLKQDNARLEETVLRSENLPFQGPRVVRPLVARPDPIDIFPPEVWKVIIGKITLYSDLEMLCLAYLQLEQMVKNLKKTVFLFEKVFPLISKKLDLKDILNCRLVCDKWNQDLCTLLANTHAQNLLPKLNDSSRGDLTTSKPPVPYRGPSLKYSTAYKFDNPIKIQRFLEKMSDHPGNPLFGRFLRFSVNERTDLSHFWKFALKLVEKFGELVWSLEVESSFRQSYSLIEFYKAVQQILVYLPNLRDLTVKYFTFDGLGPSETSTNIAIQCWNSPLPPLPHLQSVKLALNGDTGMINAFTPYFSNQIHHLELLEQTLGNIFKVESLRGLINLQHLEVALRSKQDILRLLEFPTANFEKLSLHSSNFRTFQDLDSFSSEKFASLTEKFSRLEHLSLIWCDRQLSSFLGSRIQFSGLKTLIIAVGIGEDDIQNNLDFILGLLSLKHLVILIQFMGRTDIVAYDKHSALKIRKYLYPGNMLESNIWTLMPSLELLETWGKFRAVDGVYPKGSGIFTREMFEKQVGRKEMSI